MSPNFVGLLSFHFKNPVNPMCKNISKIIPELHKRYCQLGYGGGYMMTHRQDILESFENAFRKKGMLMVLISQSFPNAEEEPVRKGLLFT